MRLRSLDSIRFVAATCVAVFHFNIDLKLKLEEKLHFINHFGLFVDFFFILSGFVIALNYDCRLMRAGDYLAFLRRRLARVYPLHLLTLLAFASLGFAATKLHVPLNHADFFGADAFPANLLLVQAWGVERHGSFNNASWSVSAEFFVYLLFPIFALMASRISSAVNICFIITFIIGMETIRLACGFQPWTSATYDYGNFRAVPTFFLGVVLAKLLPRLRPSFNPSWSWVYLLILAALTSMQVDLPDEITILIFATLIVVSACAEITKNGGIFVSPLLNVLGNASYSIYMTHGLTLIGLAYFLKRTCGLGTVAAGLAGVAALAATLILSVGVYFFFEDPLRRYLSRSNTTSQTFQVRTLQ